MPPARPAEQCRVQPGPSGPGERGGKSIVGNGWEQGSCDRNIGTSSLREAGEAGRRRNLSRKRTFVSDTSKNKISSCRRNVLNIGSAASLAHHSFQHSCKAFSKNVYDPSLLSPFMQKERHVPTGDHRAAPSDSWHPLLTGW